MGLFNFIKSQFIEVIEWADMSPDEMVYRFPVQNKEIKMGAQLTVRESQVAVFINEGLIADIFSPGRHTLSTQNLPILTKIKSWKYGFNSPFKAEVYFVSTRQFTNKKWGTTNPVMMRDKDFGMIRVRAYGAYSFKVENPEVFLKEIFGTSSSFDAASIAEYLKRIIVSSLSDLVAESKIPAMEFSQNYDELSKSGKDKLQDKFNAFGLKLSTFLIENISLPEEVEKVIDKKTSMGVIGNLDSYAKFQSAEAIEDAANNPAGGIAGAGVGLGAGAAIGNMMANSLNTNNQQQQQVPSVLCPKCNAQVKQGTKFCPECGNDMITDDKLFACPNCKGMVPITSKFCPECGQKFEKDLKCPKCSAKILPGQKFCNECGSKLDLGE